ncbi:hypothetical protein Glove_334g11 [Diversispora epigaea]|uniref:Uncharacterized protein n=1 Tax=Diversispora epigaea TaxID=1348612 RepID=A0A397HNG9_9GLOM|nr:hypothetical protein Glove_334g11 [Diversispora epigaea]
MFKTFFQWINSLKKRGLFKGSRSTITTIFLELDLTNLSIVTILQKILPEKEFAETVIQKINGGLEFYFSTKRKRKLTLYNKNGLYNYEFCALNKVVQEIFLLFPVETIERTFDDIIKIIHYCFSVNICCSQSTKDHTPFVLIEKKGQSDEIYKKIDCIIVVTENNMCQL